MHKIQKICVCGGGALGHVVAGVLGGNPKVKVNLLTRRPERWRRSLDILFRRTSVLRGCADRISNDPAEVVPGCGMVLVTTPAFAHREVYRKIVPYLQPGMLLGAIPGTGGFEWLSRQAPERGITVFGMQRSPYNCRVLAYGRTVIVAGVRGMSYVGSRPAAKAREVAAAVSRALQVPVRPLPNYLNVTLVAANALLHSCRLFSLWSRWTREDVIRRRIRFYKQWDHLASKLFMAADAEIQSIRQRTSVDLSGLEPIAEHYNAATAQELTAVLRSIESLADGWAPLSQTRGGYTPDFEHRFFTEDIAINLKVIQRIAALVNAATPCIDQIMSWGERMISDELEEWPGSEDDDYQQPSYAGLGREQDLRHFYK